jgi:hypothetical protein
VVNATLLDLLFNSLYRYSKEVDVEQIYIHHFARGLLVFPSAGRGLTAWMHWSCIEEFVIG